MTATVPAKTDPLAALQRADERWCKRHPHYDPADREYLQALAAAVTSLLQPAAGGAAPAEVECARKATALEKAQAALAATTVQLDELKAAHEELAAKHGQLHRDHAACTSLDEALHDERARFKTRVAKADERADYARIERAVLREHLSVLVEAITEQPLPAAKQSRPDVIRAAVSRALLLVEAAHANLLRREAAGEHIHTFSLAPCACGEEIPPPKGRR